MPIPLEKIFELREQGLDLIKSGEFRKAGSIFHRLYKNNTNDTEVLFMLGVVRGMEQNYRDAEHYLKEVVTRNPKMDAAFFNLALAQKSLGHVADAIESYKHAYNLNPAIPAYSNNLGNLLLEEGDYVNAVKCFQTSISLDQESPEYHYNYGRALADSGFREKAIESFNQALLLKPDFILALNGIANSHFLNGDIESAFDSYNKIIRLSPDNDEAIAGLVTINMQSGNYTVAENLLNKALSDYKSLHPAIVLAYSRLALFKDQDEKAVSLLSRCLEGNKISYEYRTQIYFMLGKIGDKSKNFRSAFKYYKKANSARNHPYKTSQQEVIIDKLIADYDSDTYKNATRSSYSTDVPIFIVGMPRSGTTLVEQIIASHPSVYGAGELDFMPQLVDGKLSEIMHYTQDNIDRLSEQYIESLSVFQSKGIFHITDKMPANYLNLAVIRLLFPQSPIIHCKRNPLDTCLSCYFQDFAGNHPYSNDLVSMGKYYIQYARLMNHWVEGLGLDFLSVDYEKLTCDTESVTRNLISYCGLNWSDSCLDFYNNKRVVVTASMDQVIKPVYTESIDRWKNYREFISPLVSILSETDVLSEYNINV